MNPVSKQEEKELIIRLIESDSSAFEKLYYVYVERVYYFALRYVKNASDAEEVVQEVFTKIWESRHNIKPELSFSGYLLTTTKNTIFNDNRKKVNHQAYTTYIINYLQNNMKDVEDEIIFNDLMNLLKKMIEKLPAKRQEIFRLCRFEGLPYKEVSAKLGISEKTIETHMRLAIRDLKTQLEPIIEKII